MKRISLLTAALVITCLSFAQMTRLSETTVESPKFTGSTSFTIDENSNCSPICQYLGTQLENEFILDEGVVSVLFTINSDGSVSNLSIENSVSTQTDKAVASVISETSGMWQPGMVNGTPAEMQRKIFVSFYDPENGTPIEQGNASLQLAIKKYNAAIDAQQNISLSAERAEKKSTNRLNSALALLKTAERFLPSEPSVVFWQAKTHELNGDEMMKTQKLNEFSSLIDPNYQATIEVVGVPL